jgi:serine/threonine protein kinase
MISDQVMGFCYWQVYKATLPDSRVVAVKKLFGRTKQSDREFRAEIETVGNCHHPNLVQLLGYCRTKDGKLLVYEYFENGSLNRFMRRNPRSKEGHLDWEARLKIAVGAAEGLAYLHNRDPRIIHRDVKASNILLDRNFEAKVSDFGLARLIDPAKTHVTTFIAGTKAYIAPEYQKSLRLTVKCDVYSYGIVLLELLTGKDPSMGRNFDIVAWVKRRMGTSLDFFDVRMVDSSHPDANKDAMAKTLHLALECTNTSPHHRPTMDEVVQQLKSLQRDSKADHKRDEEGGKDSSHQDDDDEKASLIPVGELSDTTQTSSVVTSEGMENNVFLPGVATEIPFERPYIMRVVSTPIFSEYAARGADDTRAFVTIEDVRLESQQLMLGLDNTADSPPFSGTESSGPSPDSADYIRKDYSRCESI